VFKVAIEHSFDFLSTEYAALFDRSAATPFQHPIWLDRLYRRLAPSLTAVPLVITVRARSDGRLAMLLPLLRSRYGWIRLIEFADLQVSDYVAPVCDVETFASVLRDQQTCVAIREALRPFDVLRIQKLPERALPLGELFGIRSTVSMDVNAHHTALRGPFSTWRADTISQSYRKELDKKRRELHRKGNLKFVCAEDRSSITAVFESMRGYRRARFREADDLLQKPAYFDFYLDVAGSGAETGLSRLYALLLDGEPIAGVWGLAHRESFLILLGGFDLTRFKNKSLGAIMFEEIARDCIARGDTVLDFTIGDEPYKRSFGAKPVAMSLISCTGSPIGAFAHFVAGRAPWTMKLAKRLKQRRTDAPAHAEPRGESMLPVTPP
jgi:CelD/BcsL family acetyltransferase involved in cellulose biosynthesis